MAGNLEGNGSGLGTEHYLASKSDKIDDSASKKNGLHTKTS